MSKAFQPRIVYRADREEWVLSLIAAGLGVAIMPEWQNIPAIVYIPIADLPLHRTVSLCWRTRYESDLIDKFCAFATSNNW